jgi:hypothetical protein
MKALVGLTAAIAVLGASAAHAGKIDFVAAAVAPGPADKGAIGSGMATIDGVAMTFVAGFTNALGNPRVAYAYLDDVNSAGLPGGLGVCRDADVNSQCQPANDDNITPSRQEWLEISFDAGPFQIDSISFNGTIAGVQHQNLNNFAGGTLNIRTTIGAVTTDYLGITFAAAASTVFGMVDSIYFAATDTEFYISSFNEVPVPAALPLLLSGIAGLGFASRRRRKAA